jgi:site-specific recombinase XerD
MRSIGRTVGAAPEQKAPIVTVEQRKPPHATPAETLAGRRDRALLHLGFAEGLRRSEAVSLDAEVVRSHMNATRESIRGGRDAVA